ncbi:YolD-like family protein [Bacillus pseudomycoides]|nr:hypothetical protein [Bacillus pseudomycoides]
MMDRGMMRWMPFSAIKEQSEGLNELYEKQSHIPMPILDEQQLDTINDTVCEAMATNNQVNILYHKQNKFYRISGYIHYYDMSCNELRIMGENERIKYIKSMCIVDIKML